MSADLIVDLDCWVYIFSDNTFLILSWRAWIQILNDIFLNLLYFFLRLTATSTLSLCYSISENDEQTVEENLAGVIKVGDDVIEVCFSDSSLIGLGELFWELYVEFAESYELIFLYLLSLGEFLDSIFKVID